MLKKFEFRPQRIIALREGLGLSQEEMAEKLGKKKQQISIWENGVNKPTIDNLLEICNAFDVAPDFFFDKASILVEEVAHEGKEDKA
jgi:transcriptional regulator with XRE-family HTH domain